MGPTRTPPEKTRRRLPWPQKEEKPTSLGSSAASSRPARDRLLLSLNDRSKRMRIAHIAVALTLLAPVVGAAQTVPQDTLRNAAAKGLTLLEQTSPAFIQKGGCNSCHNQMLPAAAQAFARSRRVPTGAPIAQLPPEVSEATTERYVEYS